MTQRAQLSWPPSSLRVGNRTRASSEPTVPVCPVLAPSEREQRTHAHPRGGDSGHPPRHATGPGQCPPPRQGVGGRFALLHDHGVGTQGSGLRAQVACVSHRLRWGAGSTPKAARDLQQHLKAPSPPCPPPPQRLTTAGDPTHGPRRGREQRWFGGQRSLVPPRSSVPQFPRWVQRGGGGGDTIHTDTSTFPLLRGLRSLPPATG